MLDRLGRTVKPLAAAAALLLLPVACSSSPAGKTGNPGAATGGSTGTGGSAGGAPGGTGGSPGGTGGSPGGTGGSPGGSGGSTGGSPGGTGGSPGGTGGSPGGTGGSPGGTGGSGGGAPAPDGGGNPTPITANGFAVLTNRYDNGRTGWNSHETVLNPTNVASDKFGLLFSRAIQGVVYGHVLYVPGLMIKGAKHNVMYVGTEHNMVYAYDADDPAANDPLWAKQVTPPLPFPIAGGYPKCGDMSAAGEVGITSTPVISLEDGKLFLVSKTRGKQLLHALDLLTGDDTAGSPVEITAANFDSDSHLNRPGLLLHQGNLYIGFGSHCDERGGQYHGWVFAYDSKTLKQKGVLNTTPSGAQGAIWMGGTGLSANDKGVYFSVGNGASNGDNLSFNVVRATLSDTGLSVTDKFFDAKAAAGSDLDLVAGVVHLGSTGMVVAGGKQGVMHLLDPNNLKGGPKESLTPGGAELHNFAFWEGGGGPTVYTWPNQAGLQTFKVSATGFTAGPKNTVRSTTGGPSMGHPGGMITISSNGAMNGIVWGIIAIGGDAWHAKSTAQVFAFDGSDVSKQLWTSGTGVGDLAKFSPPIVANGKVYQATFSGKVNVFGLKP